MDADKAADKLFRMKELEGSIRIATQLSSWRTSACVAASSYASRLISASFCTHKFAPTKARYIRINMLKNSDTPAVHLVEVRVFDAAK